MNDAPGDLLVMDGITKRFGTTTALRDVWLHVRRGEVHAIVGENGAGKSTLMKILSGAEHADSGRIALAGAELIPRGPQDSISAGIAMIYQELNLAHHLTIESNLLLGRERAFGKFVLPPRLSRRGSDLRRSCREVMERLGMKMSIDRQVGELGIAAQQMVEIGRALLGGASLIIMDEPTSSLASHEVERLFEVIRQLRGEGISVIYISHFLEELERICDRLTILRDGQTIASGSLAEWPKSRIIEAMVGRKVEEMYPRVPHEIGPTILQVRDLRGRAIPKSASLTLRRGEILGIAGLVGSGRTETLRTLFGLDPKRGGWATIGGVHIEHFSPAHWNSRGVGMLSEDRKAEGLAQELSCIANITLPTAGRDARWGWISSSNERGASERIGRLLKIKWAGPGHKVKNLSGGNQQKVAMGRLLHSDADVLLLDEPTRGIDVGAKVDLYAAIGELASRGKAIVVVSSYLPELFGICDTISVMCRGVLTASYPTKDLTPETVMRLAIDGTGISELEPVA